VTNKPTLGKLLEIRRPKRSSGVLFKEIAYKFYLVQIGSIKLISIVAGLKSGDWLVR
jgi:hypothetical protein